MRLMLAASSAIFGVFITGVQAQDASDPALPQAERFSDWSYRCAETGTAGENTARQCEIVQVAKVKQGEKDVSILTLAIAKTAPVAADSKGKASDSALLLTALVPLNVFLSAGFGLDADSTKIFDGMYRNCNQAGCWVQQRLDVKMVTALQKGQVGSARLSLMNGQNLTIRFSLQGLTAALARLNTKPASN